MKYSDLDPVPVQAYRAFDGTLHDTEEAALKYSIAKRAETIVNEIASRMFASHEGDIGKPEQIAIALAKVMQDKMVRESFKVLNDLFDQGLIK